MGDGGGKGGGGGAVSVSSSPYEKELAKIAKEMYGITTPLRTGQLGDWSALAESGYDPRTLPQYGGMYNLARPGLENQYDIAKQNVLGSVPQGGGLTSALTNLERGRAETVGGLSGQIGTDLLNQELQKKFGVAWNVPGQSMQGLGTASQSYAQRYQAALMSQSQQSNQKGGMMGALGSGLGMILGSAVPGIGTALGGALGGGLGSAGGSLIGTSNAYSTGGRFW